MKSVAAVEPNAQDHQQPSWPELENELGDIQLYFKAGWFSSLSRRFKAVGSDRIRRYRSRFGGNRWYANRDPDFDSRRRKILQACTQADMEESVSDERNQHES